MSPMEKMAEVVRALEEIAPGPCTCLPYATEGSPEECASCDNARHAARALTLARELRNNAVEEVMRVACPGGVDEEGEPYECEPPTYYPLGFDLTDWECGSCGATVDGRYGGRTFIVAPALLILSEPTPSREEACNR